MSDDRPVTDQKPIDMVLHCPVCQMQHIDAPELHHLDYALERNGLPGAPDASWHNPPHRSHLCHNPACHHIWRPADVPTNGVAAVQTKGKADSPIVAPEQAEHEADMASPDYRAGWNDAMNVMTKAMLRASLAASPQAPQAPQASHTASVSGWLRDQRDGFEGPETLDPLFLLGAAPPGAGVYRATYSPLVSPAPSAVQTEPAETVPLDVQAVPGDREALVERLRKHYGHHYTTTREGIVTGEHHDFSRHPLVGEAVAALALPASPAPVAVLAALRRLEQACDRRAALLTPAAYNLAELTPGMREALIELDGARDEARRLLAASPAAPNGLDPACGACGVTMSKHDRFLQCPAPDAVQPDFANMGYTPSADRDQADQHLRALLRHTESFYGAAIQHGMKAGETANAIAHVESAGKALHRLVHAWATVAESAAAQALTPDAQEAVTRAVKKLATLRAFLAGWRESGACVRNQMQDQCDQWIGGVDELYRLYDAAHRPNAEGGG